MLPKEHPLHKIIKSHRMSKVKRYKGLLHHLVRWFKLDALKTKKIPTVARDPSKIGKIPIQISITDSREDSIAEAENTKEEVQIFSDGSALKGKVGTAAVLIYKGRHTQTLYYHLRSDEEHIVHEAKLVCILLRLHVLSSRKSRKASATIGVDNQAAIKAFTSDLRNLGHHLIREALCIASKISKERKKGGKNKHALTIRWMAGHKGIEGNELADREAKEAAKGCTSDMKLLPHYLRKPILTNSSTVKKAHNESLAKEWQEEWRNLKQGKVLTLFNESTPSSKFLKSLSNPKLLRTVASMVT
jgi:ribonuclease HI